MPGGCRVWTEGMSMRKRTGNGERGDAGICRENSTRIL